MRLCPESLDRLGIAWLMCRRDPLSVTRREAEAELDRHVGPTACRWAAGQFTGHRVRVIASS